VRHAAFVAAEMRRITGEHAKSVIRARKRLHT
jgi:hypothetical protein